MKSEGCHSNFIFIEINTGKTSCTIFGDIYCDQSDQMSTLFISKYLYQYKSWPTCQQYTADVLLGPFHPSWKYFYISTACHWTRNSERQFWKILPSFSDLPPLTGVFSGPQDSQAWEMSGPDVKLWPVILVIHHLWFPKWFINIFKCLQKSALWSRASGNCIFTLYRLKFINIKNLR